MKVERDLRARWLWMRLCRRIFVQRLRRGTGIVFGEVDPTLTTLSTPRHQKCNEGISIERYIITARENRKYQEGKLCRNG